MAEQDIQIGAGTILGIAGAYTITPSGGSDLGGNANISSVSRANNWTLDELANAGGTMIESAIASKCFRDLEIEFIVKGTTRAAAETAIDTFNACTPLQIITIAAATATAINLAGNLLPGMRTGFTREGRAQINFSIRQYQGSDGSYGALAIISG